METIENILKSNMFLMVLMVSIVILFILYIINIISLIKLRKSYNKFMNKLGNGNNIDEMLRTYLNRVEDVAKKNEEIISYCKELDNDMAKCTQKIGIVRYNAFKDTGSDLSFTLALLNEYNDGVVLNGIYSRDMSNIYAKPVKQGKSPYTLSEEEKQAIEKAIDNIE